jgi:hypothetical protein
MVTRGDSLTQWLQRELQTMEDSLPAATWLGAPGRSIGVPTAYGGSWGDVGLGFVYQRRSRVGERDDGSTAAVVGFGDRHRLIGLDVTVAILDLTSRSGKGGFGRRGSFGFLLSRELPAGFAVAAGVENTLVWGGTDTGTSTYGVVSRTLVLKESAWDPFSRAYLSVGVGNARFRSDRSLARGRDGVGVFGAVTVQVAPPLGVVAEWTGQDLNVGASIVPLRNVGLVLTPSLVEVIRSAGNGPRFVLSAGWGFTLPAIARDPFRRRGSAGEGRP